MILTPEYFKSKDTIGLARSLLGKYLVREIGTQCNAYMICEVEAYHGIEDKACHANRGKTQRNQVMFASGGIWYVYLCYGIHWMLNIVSGEAEHPAAILIRGVDHLRGPGKVTKYLGIDKQLNGLPASPESGLWIEDQGFKPQKVVATPRIGIAYAGDYQDKLWRFVLDK